MRGNSSNLAFEQLRSVCCPLFAARAIRKVSRRSFSEGGWERRSGMLFERPERGPLPNLRASPERVRKYAASNGLPEIAERAAAVAKSLGSEPLAPGTPPR